MNIRVECESEEIGARPLIGESSLSTYAQCHIESIVNAFLSSYFIGQTDFEMARVAGLGSNSLLFCSALIISLNNFFAINNF